MGDDAAVLADGLLMATDLLAQGVHFDLAWCSGEDVGWKALAVNCSDVAAMGGVPTAAVVALAVPGVPGLAESVMEGLAEAAVAFGCPLVGGDTSAAPLLVVSVAVVGRAAPAGAVRRCGARPGDQVFVTGALGAAASALRVLQSGGTPPASSLARLRRPDPRLAEGLAAGGGGASSMIDVSDGLARDLSHLCQESGVGMRLWGRRIPLAPGASLEQALRGGDDYELAFTAPEPAVVVRSFDRRGLPPPLSIGEVVAGTGLVLTDDSGEEQPLSTSGWEHRIVGSAGESVPG